MRCRCGRWPLPLCHEPHCTEYLRLLRIRVCHVNSGSILVSSKRFLFSYSEQSNGCPGIINTTPFLGMWTNWRSLAIPAARVSHLIVRICTCTLSSLPRLAWQFFQCPFQTNGWSDVEFSAFHDKKGNCNWNFFTPEIGMIACRNTQVELLCLERNLFCKGLLMWKYAWCLDCQVLDKLIL